MKGKELRIGGNVFHDIRIKIVNWLARESRSVCKMKSIQLVMYLASLGMVATSFVAIFYNPLYVLFTLSSIALSWAIKTEKSW